LNSMPNAGVAARAWRKDLEEANSFTERVFSSDPASGRREGIRFIADLAFEALKTSPDKVISLVDSYGFDAHALLRIAAAASKVPGGEIRLLTRNESPPGAPANLDYERFAAIVARRLGVTIQRWNPTRRIHDRYLWIGNRIWHVGHSFNQFGTDLSAVVEFHSLDLKATLAEIFSNQFSRQPDGVYR
jgi:hypothetical protein